jgi:hypothetical protein
MPARALHTVKRALVCIILTAIFAGEAFAQDKQRVALVIGNSTYTHTRALPNPRNDAAAVAALFRKHGYDVTEALDLAYKPMREAIRAFAQSAATADTAMVYFAGHGIELAGENYLVPIDAKLTSSDDLEYEAIKLTSLLTALGKARRLSLILLDACRDNPLAEKMLMLNAKRSVDRGLGRIEAKGDILIAYAAQAGRVALDGDTRHSPFTHALLENLADPHQDIRMAFGGVRDAVRRATGGKQEPYVSQSLGGGTVGLLETTEVKTQPGALVPAGRPAMPATLPSPPADAGARIAWDSVKDSCSVEDLDRFAERHKGTPFAELARQRIRLIETKAECAAWLPSKAVVAPASPPGASPKAADKSQSLPAKGVASPAKDKGEVDWRNPKIPANAGASCDATRSACASIRTTCMKACRQEMAERSYGNCNACITGYPICVRQGSNGACD